MRNLKLRLAYDGTDFAGWQVQPKAATIQGTLSTALGRVTRETILPQGAGRTDAGVHALEQIASFRTASPIPPGNLLKALNDILPVAIRVLEVEEVAADFHARKSARAKTYRYRILRQPICPPFVARYVWHFPYSLKENAMTEAAQCVVGEHNFASFAAVDPEVRFRSDRNDTTDASCAVLGSGDSPARDKSSPVRRIYSSQWQRIEDEFIYTVRGNGFLHHMVRNLVGTFILVGKGTRTPEDIPRILQARNRQAAGATAPANGLCLVSVEY